jgi:hypothetical protein
VSQEQGLKVGEFRCWCLSVKQFRFQGLASSAKRASGLENPQLARNARDTAHLLIPPCGLIEEAEEAGEPEANTADEVPETGVPLEAQRPQAPPAVLHLQHEDGRREDEAAGANDLQAVSGKRPARRVQGLGLHTRQVGRRVRQQGPHAQQNECPKQHNPKPYTLHECPTRQNPIS